jgi:tetratricopeptide (TPR) repeat protein
MRCYVVLLCLVVGAVSASARDSVGHWFEVRSPHFVVLTDSNEKEGLRVASQFERMRAVFHLVMPSASDSAGSPIIVVALKDKKAMQTLEPEVYLAKGQLNLAGLFMRAPDKNYILLRLDAEGQHPFATVYHEYTHYMLRNASEWMPLWLNEGLAEFYQNTDIQNKEVLMGQASSDDILYLRQNRLLPLTTLFKVDASSPYYHEEQKASVFYAESWALTHMIEISDAQKNLNRLQNYADLLSHKQDSISAAQQAFGDLTQLQNALNRYISQGQFMMFKMNKAVAVDESTFQVRAIPTTDADAIRADVMVYSQRTRDAEALIDSVLHEDPNNALAHETMGFLKFREGDKEAARKWYGEAVKLDSQSYLAHYYFAAISMGADGEAGGPAIESSLQTCIRLNPGFAPAYDALARYYSRDATKAKEAHMMNIRAISLEPDNLNYRLNAAYVLMNEQQYDNAISVLKTAAHVAKTPEEVAVVESRISQIQQYQAAVAQNHAVMQQGARGTPSPTTFVSDTRTATIASSDGRTLVLKPNGPDDHPQYPTEEPTGVHHTVRGILRNVHCSYPLIITLSVDQGPKGPPIALYRNDFQKIEFSATNFTPKGDLNPCTDMEGLKAMVQYAEVSDKSIAGQIVSVQLTK